MLTMRTVNWKRSGNHREKDWSKASIKVRAWLNAHGIKAYAAGYHDAFDFRTEYGDNVEVKWCALIKSAKGRVAEWKWQFNIHRHGVLDESQVDFYVLRCEPGPAKEFLGENAFHLVIPAPLGVKVMVITPRSLLTRHAKFYNGVGQLKNGKRGIA
jgi:hypothetical protein